jgi:hypothetical protein
MEIKDLLLRLISNQQDINDVRDMEAEGIPVAERLMEDGEEVMSLLWFCSAGGLLHFVGTISSSPE